MIRFFPELMKKFSGRIKVVTQIWRTRLKNKLLRKMSMDELSTLKYGAMSPPWRDERLERDIWKEISRRADEKRAAEKLESLAEEIVEVIIYTPQHRTMKRIDLLSGYEYTESLPGGTRRKLALPFRFFGKEVYFLDESFSKALNTTLTKKDFATGLALKSEAK